MTQERSTRTVLATVKSKAEAEDGAKLELVIPEFKSDYPTVVTRVDSQLATQLQVGGTYSLVLEQQNLKRGKTGERPYDYYYGLLRIATGPERVPQGRQGAGSVVAPTPPAGAVGSPIQWEYSGRDDTRISIERQKALDIAERFYARFAADDATTTINEHSKRLLALAQRLALWLESGQVPREASRPAPATQGASQWPAGAVPTGQGNDPMPEDEEPPF